MKLVSSTRPQGEIWMELRDRKKLQRLLATTSETPDAESTAPAAEQPDEADIEPDPVPRLDSAALERLRQQLT